MISLSESTKVDARKNEEEVEVVENRLVAPANLTYKDRMERIS